MATAHGLQQKALTDATLRGLERYGPLFADLTAPAVQVAAPALTLVRAAAPRAAAAFPLGVTARTLDRAGRIKPQLTGGALSALLGWRGGVLETTLIDGFLTLTQRPEQVGARRGRSSANVGFTVTRGGVERICLRPAHLVQMDVSPGDCVVLAAIPNSAALVIINPAVLAVFAPQNVQNLLADDRPAVGLALVPDTPVSRETNHKEQAG